MNNVISRLRQHNLTKTEALTILNLGIGLDRSHLPKTNEALDQDTKTVQQETSGDGEDKNMEAPTSDTLLPNDPANIETSEQYHRLVLSCVIEKFDERFQGEEGEEQVQQILGVLQDCIPLSSGSRPND